MTTHWEKVLVKAQLVSLPELYLKLKKIIDQGDYSLADITQLISLDPGLSARLLRIANSSYFGFAAQIESVHHAISILGVQQLHDLVLATSVADSLGKYGCAEMDMKLYWQRSVYCAICSKQLASSCNLIDSERLFVIGLLNDIGHLMMYQAIPELAQQAYHDSVESGRPLHIVEQEVLGFDYAMLAGELLKQWQLPANMAEVLEFHMQPEAGADQLLETSIVHIAALMAKSFSSDFNIEDSLASASSSALQATGLTREHCQAADLATREQLGEVMNLLFAEQKFAAA